MAKPDRVLLVVRMVSMGWLVSVINQFEGSIATFDEGRFSKRPMRNSVGIATDAVSY
jgi:hypothetical protein